MAKWTNKNNCYSYAVDYPNKWLLINDGDYRGGVKTLSKVNNFRLVSKQDLELGKEYVAYRYSSSDFHFMKRGKDGHWRHKMGGSPVEAISTKVVFGKVWDLGCHVYNSKLYLYEVL